MSANYIIPRLTYEILNCSLDEIADTLGLTAGMVKEIAEKQNWVRWFPDEEDDIFSLGTTETQVDEDLLEGENIFTVRADQFLDKNRKRLQVFNMAKELAMAQQYADLEVAVVEKARNAIQLLNPEDVRDLKDIASIFKDLAKNIQTMSSAISMGKDESGLPTLIIRDLSGT